MTTGHAFAVLLLLAFEEPRLIPQKKLTASRCALPNDTVTKREMFELELCLTVAKLCVIHFRLGQRVQNLGSVWMYDHRVPTGYYFHIQIFYSVRERQKFKSMWVCDHREHTGYHPHSLM